MSEKSILSEIRNKAGSDIKKIVFPEAGIDIRVIKAAVQMAESGLVSPVLLSVNQDLEKLLNESDIKLPDGIEVIRVADPGNHSDLSGFLRQRLSHKNPTAQQIQELASDRLVTAGWLVATGKADGAVAGSVASTASVIRAALRTIGVSKGTKLVSGIFLMELPGGRVLTYGDCAVVPYPNAEQLADIALTSAKTHSLLTGEQPRVALLSFSTKGSAVHERTELVINALSIIEKSDNPPLADGELQFDTAFVPHIAERKAPHSEVAGNANVMIFPNLDAGNIAYKITERIGGAKAVGPILQGLAKPYMDLSRGCTVDDIVDTACVAAVLSRG